MSDSNKILISNINDPGSWSTEDCEEARYSIRVDVQIHWRVESEKLSESIRRDDIQRQVDVLVYAYLSDPLNKQNLLIRIFKNTGIIVGET